MYKCIIVCRYPFLFCLGIPRHCSRSCISNNVLDDARRALSPKRRKMLYATKVETRAALDWNVSQEELCACTVHYGSWCLLPNASHKANMLWYVHAISIRSAPRIVLYLHTSSTCYTDAIVSYLKNSIGAYSRAKLLLYDISFTKTKPNLLNLQHLMVAAW